MSDTLPLPLPAEITSRVVPDVNGLSVHLLESGPDRGPLVLLLHGFPELAFSWRKVIGELARAGFHVVAPDQRGYGRTLRRTVSYDADPSESRITNLVRDQFELVAALGYQDIHAVVGHDFGSPVAAYCALIRPDVFRRVVLMSAPFGGPPQQHGNTDIDIDDAVAQLTPPRKHYQRYFATPEAGKDMRDCPQGISRFLRAYYHYKSADWPGNYPMPLKSAQDIAQLPKYYLLNAHDDMPHTVALQSPTLTEARNCAWLTEAELAAYTSEYTRTGFQGGLQWYRCNLPGGANEELKVFAEKVVSVPSLFIAGARDWGVYQTPGSFEAMRAWACTDLRGVHLIEGAGHWVQQERPRETLDCLMPFLLAD